MEGAGGERRSSGRASPALSRPSHCPLGSCDKIPRQKQLRVERVYSASTSCMDAVPHGCGNLSTPTLQSAERQQEGPSCTTPKAHPRDALPPASSISESFYSLPKQHHNRSGDRVQTLKSMGWRASHIQTTMQPVMCWESCLSTWFLSSFIPTDSFREKAP